jgi:hypothetical protein
MTVTIELPPEIEVDMLAQAEAEGMPVGDYLQSLLSGQVSARSGRWRRSSIPTFCCAWCSLNILGTQ